MTQYIDKSALVAEIKRQILAIDNTPKITDTQISVLSGNKVTLTKLLSFIDTLEVKDVDSTESFIEKAWDWIENNLLSSNQQDKSRLYFEQFKNYMKGE